MCRFGPFWRKSRSATAEKHRYYVIRNENKQRTDDWRSPNFEKDLLDKKNTKRTVKTSGQAWSWALRGNSWRRPEQCSTGSSQLLKETKENRIPSGERSKSRCAPRLVSWKAGKLRPRFLEREETTVFFGSVMILNVYTPETSRKTESSWRMWRRLCKKIVGIEDDFYIELDCCVQVMTMTRRCKTWNVRVQCWHRLTVYPRRIQKTMFFVVMKNDRMEKAFAHKVWWTSQGTFQLDDTCAMYIHNKVKLSSTWDYCQKNSMKQKNDGHNYFSRQTSVHWRCMQQLFLNRQWWDRMKRIIQTTLQRFR